MIGSAAPQYELTIMRILDPALHIAGLTVITLITPTTPESP
jgi:hypothetical protein